MISGNPEFAERPESYGVFIFALAPEGVASSDVFYDALGKIITGVCLTGKGPAAADQFSHFMFWIITS